MAKRKTAVSVERRPTATGLTPEHAETLMLHRMTSQVGPLYRPEPDGGFGVYMYAVDGRVYIHLRTYAEEHEALRALTLILNGLPVTTATSLMN